MSSESASGAAPVRPDGNPWLVEVRATFVLGWPLILAQLATMALTTTDVVMMGWLGPEFLAAGTLAQALMYPAIVTGMGVVMASAPVIAQAVGARDFKSVRRSVRQGFWLSAACALVLTPLLANAAWLMLLLGQDPDTTALSALYLQIAAWQLLPVMIFITLRGLVAAHGSSRIVVTTTLVGVAVNALGNYCLMFGNFGFPRLELVGAGIATVIVHSSMALILLTYVLRHRRMRRYAILARLWKPDWPRFRLIFWLGLPIGCMMFAETSLFTGAAMLMGWLGTDELAAHAVALQLAALSFMVPMGLSQATTVRVGLAHGRFDSVARARAGWVSLFISILFMGVIALIFWQLPEPLVHLFLDPELEENQVPVALAIGYLGIAALFQLADGAQVTAAGALRGMSDTTVPALVAIFGYWGIGIPIAYVLGFIVDLQGVGIWLGLAGGLSFAAILLGWRMRRLAEPIPPAPGPVN